MTHYAEIAYKLSINKPRHYIEPHRLHDYNKSLPNIKFAHSIRTDIQYVDSVILLVRHPLDVFVSSYFQYNKRENGEDHFKGTISDYLKHTNTMSNIIDLYNTWINACNYCITYEDMMQDFTNTIYNLFNHIGMINCNSNIAIKKVKKITSFRRLREKESNNFYCDVRMKPLDISDPESFKVRKGKIGGYKDYLSQVQIDYLMDIVANNLSDKFTSYKKEL